MYSTYSSKVYSNDKKEIALIIDRLNCSVKK